jgi:hypothetical protein
LIITKKKKINIEIYKNKGVDIETKIDNDEKTILSKKDKNEKVNEKILLGRSTKIK